MKNLLRALVCTLALCGVAYGQGSPAYNLGANSYFSTGFFGNTGVNLNNSNFLVTGINLSNLTINPARLGVPAFSGNSGLVLSNNGSAFTWTAGGGSGNVTATSPWLVNFGVTANTNITFTGNGTAMLTTAIGTTVQAYNANLTTCASIAPNTSTLTANLGLYGLLTGTQTYSGNLTFTGTDSFSVAPTSINTTINATNTQMPNGASVYSYIAGLGYGTGTVQNLSTGSTGFTASGNGTGTLTFSGQLNLANISTTSAVSNQVMTYNGSAWHQFGVAGSNGLNLGGFSTDNGVADSTNLGVGAASTGANGTTVGYLASSGGYGFAAGADAVAGSAGIAIGSLTNATAQSLAIGYQNVANGTSGIAIGGNGEKEYGSSSILIATSGITNNVPGGIFIQGNDLDTADSYSMVMGLGAQITGNDNTSESGGILIAGGDGGFSESDGGLAIGVWPVQIDSQSLAAGFLPQNDGSAGVALGYFSHSWADGEISIGGGQGLSSSVGPKGEGVNANNAYIGSNFASRYYRYPYHQNGQSPVVKDTSGVPTVMHGTNGLDTLNQVVAGNFTAPGGAGGRGQLLAFATVVNGTVTGINVISPMVYNANTTYSILDGAGTGATFAATNSSGYTNLTVTNGGSGYVNTTFNLPGQAYVIEPGLSTGTGTPGSFRVEMTTPGNVSNNNWNGVEAGLFNGGQVAPDGFIVGPAAFGSTTVAVVTVNGTLNVANTTTLSNLAFSANTSANFTGVTVTGLSTGTVTSALASSYTTPGSGVYANTGLSCALVAGKTYKIELRAIYHTDTGGGGSYGFQLAYSSTFSASTGNGNSFLWDDSANNSQVTYAQITGTSSPIGTMSGSTTGTADAAIISYLGTITVTGAGNLIFQINDFGSSTALLSAGAILICTPQ